MTTPGYIPPPRPGWWVKNNKVAFPLPATMTLTGSAPQVPNTVRPPGATLTLTGSTPTLISSTFVARDPATGNLTFGGSRFRFAGNNWAGLGLNEDANAYGGTVVTTPVAGRGSYALHLSTHSEIDDYLAQCVAMNATVIRTFAAMTIGHVLSVQPTLGTFNSANLEPLDYALQQCALHGIRMILPLTDNYELFVGGKFDYCRMNSVTPDSQASQFFTNTTIINSFKAHINFVLNHVNAYTGVRYKDDTAILAWETGNEIGMTPESTFHTWTENIAAYIKTQAQQLVMDGGCIAGPITFDTSLIPSVDILTQHPYNIDYGTLSYTAGTAADAHAAGKAFVWGEWPPNGLGFPLNIFGQHQALGWTYPGLVSTIEGLESDGDMFWALYPSLEGHEADFNIHSPGDNAGMITRVSQFTAHAAAMPTLITSEMLSDNMTGANGTLLHNHTADSGSTWVKQSGSTGDGTIEANRIWFGSTDAHYVSSGQPPSADYDVTANVRIVSAAAGAIIYVDARAVAGEKTAYTLRLLNSSGTWSLTLYRDINGASTQIDTATISAPSNGSDHTLTLRVHGTEITALWDNVTLIGADDNWIRGAGKAGLGGINNTSTTGLHVDSVTVSAIPSNSVTAIAPPNNVTVAIGDSITDYWSAYDYQPWLGPIYLNQLHVLSKQRIEFGGVYATGGFDMTQIRATHLPQVLALNPKPGACIMYVSTNDVGQAHRPFSMGYTKSVFFDIINQLLAAGIAPILATVGPHDDYPTYTPWQMTWNAFVRQYATANGLAYIDAWAAVATSSNTYKAGYSFDGLHPTEVGHKAIAQQAITGGLPSIFPATPTGLTIGSNNLINLGTFTTDSNADGIADGLVKTSGTGLCSLVAPQPADNLAGNWQELRHSTTGQTLTLEYAVSGWIAGAASTFAARIQTVNVTSTATPWYVLLEIAVPGGYTVPNGASLTIVEVGAISWPIDTDGLLYVNYTIPPGATSITAKITLNPITAGEDPRLRIGELTVSRPPVFYPAPPLLLPNRNVGPMALRHLYRQPTPSCPPNIIILDIYDFGTPASTGTDIYDGGSPSSTGTDIYDGGAP